MTIIEDDLHRDAKEFVRGCMERFGQHLSEAALGEVAEKIARYVRSVRVHAAKAQPTTRL